MSLSSKTVPIGEVMSDVDLKNRLTECHMAIYNEVGPSEWGEAWTVDEAEVDLYGLGLAVHDNTFVTLIQDDGRIVGFSVIAIGRASQVITPEEMPPGFKDWRNASGVRQGVQSMAGVLDPMMAYYRHFGIVKSSRRGSSLPAKLIAGVEPEATRSGIEWAGGWTLTRTVLFAILKARGFQVVYDFPGGGKVYMGCVPTPQIWAKFARTKKAP